MRLKSGKTTGATSGEGKCLLINEDLPNATRFAHRVSFEEITEVVIETVADLTEIAVEVKAETLETDWIVLDPVGELHRRLLEDMSGRAIRPTLNQYGDAATYIERFCRGICESPYKSVFVCHDWPIKDEATGVMERLPWTGTTNPALGSKLAQMVDIVGYTGAVETPDGYDYQAQLINGRGRRGGDRFAALGEFRSLDLSEWMGQINTTQEATRA